MDGFLQVHKFTEMIIKATFTRDRNRLRPDPFGTGTELVGISIALKRQIHSKSVLLSGTKWVHL